MAYSLATPFSVSFVYILRVATALRVKRQPKVALSFEEAVSSSCRTRLLRKGCPPLLAASADFSDPSSSDDSSNNVGLSDFSSDEADI